MSFWIYSGIIALVAIIGCLIIKKIQPEWFKWYKWYALAIWLIFTIFEYLYVAGS